MLYPMLLDSCVCCTACPQRFGAKVSGRLSKRFHLKAIHAVLQQPVVDDRTDANKGSTRLLTNGLESLNC